MTIGLAERVEWGGVKSVLFRPGKQLPSPELVVVLCHGYGAPAGDLVGLAQAFVAGSPALSERVAFVFPAAILDMAGQGLPGGRAWWPLDLDRLLNRPSAETLVSFRRDCPAGMTEAMTALAGLVEAASRELSVPQERFVLGGFSQGSMLAIDVALRMPAGPAGLIVLSGSLVNETQWRDLAPRHAPLIVLQSHGRRDQILPFSQAEALRDLLVGQGSEVEFIPFDGFHEIPPVVVNRAAAMLERLLKLRDRGENALA
ncbi:MAG: lysophospholipase [Pirellulaceae bacterium]